MSGSGSVLIADDDKAFCCAACDALGKAGHRCDDVPDGTEAIRLLREWRYDLLIAETEIAGNTRLELVGRSQEITPGMPVILVTGAPSIESAVKSVQLSVTAYLIKPVDLTELRSYVDRAVARGHVFRIIQDAQEQLDCWSRDLEAVGSLFRQPGASSAAEPVSAFVAMSMRNVSATLDQLGRLTETLTAGRSLQEQRETVASAQLDTARNALIEAIGVLEQTKSLFKSKKLAQLRRKLQVVVDEWQQGRGEPSI